MGTTDQAEVVITHLKRRPSRRRRTLDELLIARFPRAFAVASRLGLRLFRPGSKVRRALVARNIRSGWAALGKRDFDLLLARYAPEVEYSADPALMALGVRGGRRGREGMRTALVDIAAAWSDLEMIPHVILDAGERMVVLGRMHGTGATSGVVVEEDFTQVLDFRDGAVVEEHDYRGWDAGLRIVGVDQEAIQR
jgi:ketosteroid isomerase-like protein